MRTGFSGTHRAGGEPVTVSPIVIVMLTVVGAPAPETADDDVISFVRRVGGEVTRDRKRAGNPVVSIELCTRNVTDADLEYLAGLKHLRRLRLCGNPITD